MTYELVVTEDAVSAHEGVVLDALSPHLQPIRRCEVDSLGQVVALVEAGVVGTRERDDELACVLVNTVHGHTMGLKQKVRHSLRIKGTPTNSILYGRAKLMHI